MRGWLWVAACAAACGGAESKPAGSEASFDVDLQAWEASKAPATAEAQAPPVERIRAGDIQRSHLDRVVANGPGYFLRRVELTPAKEDGEFVGHRVVRVVDPTLKVVDILPGDIVRSVNTLPVATPQDLTLLWESLRSAVELRVQMQRGDLSYELVFRVLDP